MAGTRKPPSQFVFFSLRNGLLAASGQIFRLSAIHAVHLQCLFVLVAQVNQFGRCALHPKRKFIVLDACDQIIMLPGARMGDAGEIVMGEDGAFRYTEAKSRSVLVTPSARVNPPQLNRTQ